MAILTLSAIYLYPVKSLAGISVKEWPVTLTGLQYDRKWMLVDPDGNFLSQRKLPAMALINTALDHNRLILSAPGMEDLSLPLQTENGESINCMIWADHCRAMSVSAHADEWLSTVLRHDCRLVYQADDNNRPVDPAYSQAQDRVAFSDGFPFLIIAENSLVALNQAMGLSLSMHRFRPNLVASSCAAYAEDSWREIRIGAIDFRLPKPCARCSVPTIDPQTAESTKEPLATLSRIRKWRNKVYFGQNALHNQCGILTVGDTVTVSLFGAPQPPI